MATRTRPESHAHSIVLLLRRTAPPRLCIYTLIHALLYPRLRGLYRGYVGTMSRTVWKVLFGVFTIESGHGGSQKILPIPNKLFHQITPPYYSYSFSTGNNGYRFAKRLGHWHRGRYCGEGFVSRQDLPYVHGHVVAPVPQPRGGLCIPKRPAATDVDDHGGGWVSLSPCLSPPYPFILLAF